MPRTRPCPSCQHRLTIEGDPRGVACPFCGAALTVRRVRPARPASPAPVEDAEPEAAWEAEPEPIRPAAAQNVQNVVHFSMPPRSFNHLPHAVLSLFTCGFWLPLWLILWACHSE